LQRQFNSNINDNISHFQFFATFPTLGVDYAPGDFNTGTSSRKNSMFSASSRFLNHTFVPTSSSFSISNNQLLTSAQNSSFIQRINPFNGLEVIYSTEEGFVDGNKPHVLITQSITNSMIANQTMSKSSFSDTSLNASINIARPLTINNSFWAMNADVELAPWRVGNGGHLGINRNQPVNVTGHPLQSINRPWPNSHFVTKTSTFDCDSVPVIVESGGLIELGQIQPGNALTAEVYFRKASSLTLFSGSTLKVNNRSTLIIEQGSTLFIHPGANIILDGDSAVLEIRGRVVLVGNAVFRFSGNGFVRINQPSSSPTNLWSFGSGSGIRIIGTGKSDKKIEVIGDFKMLDTAAFIDIRSARVELMAGSRMNVHGKTNLENVHFTGPGQRAHHGVMVHGQSQLKIANCLFTNGKVGLSANLLTYNGSITLEQVIFNNNLIGLETFGRSASLFQCEGRQNVVFWRAYDIEGISRVRNCQILSNNEGIHVMGQHGAQLDILESRLDSNFRAVMAFGDLKLKPYCSSFSNNNTGIYAGNTHVLLGGNASNSLRNNHEAIYLEEVDNLFLVNGYNDFSGSNWYITGRFTGIAHNHLTIIPNLPGYFINVSNNRMPLLQQQLPIDIEDGDGNPVLATQWTFLNATPFACARIATADYDYWVLSTASSSVPVEVGGSTKALPLALLDAIQLVSKNEVIANPQDLQAIQQFNEIFQSIRTNFTLVLNKEEKLILNLGLTRMIEAVSNAYRYSLLQAARGDEEFPLSTAIAWTEEEILHRISALNHQTDIQKINELRLQLAHVYRIGEYYQQALMLLEDIINSNQYDSEAHIQAIYWHCVCQVEERLVKGEIGADEFETLRLPCLQQLPEARKPSRQWQAQTIQNSANQTELAIKAFPNPVTDFMTLEQFEDNGAASISLYTMQGQLLLSKEWVNPYERYNFSLAELPVGIYHLEIVTENGKKSFLKVVKK